MVGERRRRIKRGEGAYGAVSTSESCHAALCLLELIVREGDAVDFDDGVPELLVLLFQDQDDARGPGVKGAGDVLDGVVDKFCDAGVGDGGSGGEFVEGATLFG